MGLVGFAGSWYIVGLESGFAVLSTIAYAMSSKYLLTIIPLYIAMVARYDETGIEKSAKDNRMLNTLYA